VSRVASSDQTGEDRQAEFGDLWDSCMVEEMREVANKYHLDRQAWASGPNYEAMVRDGLKTPMTEDRDD
jgi:hypothetical protein